MQEAEDIMDRLNDVIPKIEAVVSPQIDLNQASEEEVIEAGQLFESMNSILDKEISRLNSENEEIDIQIKGLTQKLPVIPDFILEKVDENTGEEKPPAVDIQLENIQIEDIQIEDIQIEDESIYMDTLVQEEGTVLEQASNLEVSALEKDILAVAGTPTMEKTVPETKKALGDEIRSLSNTIIFDKVMEEELAALASKTNVLSLSDEQKAIFSYFMPVKGMEKQLCKALAGVVENLKESPTAARGNLIIQGSQGCGKTVLATSIVKVLQMECGKPNGRIGKIDAEALNKKDLHELLKKVAGGCLIIERAGEIDRTTAVSLSLLLEQDESGLLVIIEDSAIGIKKALAMDDGFAKKFTESVTVPIFTNDELVVFAQSYANELGYEIDEMAILALHNRISNIEKLDQETTLVEVKEIIDEAIEREARGSIRKAFNILTAKRYTDDDKIVLTEKDFE